MITANQGVDSTCSGPNTLESPFTPNQDIRTQTNSVNKHFTFNMQESTTVKVKARRASHGSAQRYSHLSKKQSPNIARR